MQTDVRLANLKFECANVVSVLRPAFQQGSKATRAAYCKAYAERPGFQSHFTDLTVIPFDKFVENGVLPRSSDRVTVAAINPAGEDKFDFYVFISYRWLRTLALTEGQKPHPDDENGTIWKQVVKSVRQALTERGISEGRAALWMDFACIEQDEFELKVRGVQSLMTVVMCVDAVLTIHSDGYFGRAWCATEVLFTQTLRDAYGESFLLWLVAKEAEDGSVEISVGETQSFTLASTALSFESDRPQVMFFNQQAKLLASELGRKNDEMF